MCLFNTYYNDCILFREKSTFSFSLKKKFNGSCKQLLTKMFYLNTKYYQLCYFNTK